MEKAPNENPKVPEGYSGRHISIDEMNPKFNSDGTIELNMYSMHERLTEGEIILLGSNENPEREGYGEVKKIEGNKVKIKLLD